MSHLGQRISELNPKIIWKLGIALFIISFIIPGGPDFRFFAGAFMFVVVPGILMEFLWPSALDSFTAHAERMDALYQAIVLSIAWFSNVPIFFRLPTFAALAAIALLWSSYVCLFPDSIRFIPFYPWALGITLVHLSTILSRRQSKIAKQGFGITKDGFVVTARWPGVDSKGIEIWAEGSRLRIVGKRPGGAVPYEFDVPVPLGYDPARAQATCFKGTFSIIVPKTPS